MYLTAQKVIAPDGRTGINAFLHLHVDGTFPEGPVSEKTVILVAEEHTGILIEELLELRPGGNRVNCYLDVVAPDRTAPDEIFKALDQFERRLPTTILPIVRVFGCVGIGLNADVALWDSISKEFEPLRAHLEEVFKRLPPAG